MRIVVFLGALLSASCVTSKEDLAGARREFGTEGATRSSFWHCSGYGCRFKKQLGFTNSEWREVQSLFAGAESNDTGAQERARIRRAIWKIETIVGAKTGTSLDEGGTFEAAFKTGQMDCVDEMLNVATFIDLLIREKLVTKHRLGNRYTNQLFKAGPWPHTATSIVDLNTGEEFIVDSWWLKNGNPPYVLPLKQWTEGDWNEPKSQKAKRAQEAAFAAELQ